MTSEDSLSIEERAQFFAPNWNAPLDPVRYLLTIPATATISGMFLLGMVNEAQERGLKLASAAPRYLPFNFYPVRDHVQLMFDYSQAMFPSLPLRQGVRKIGHGASHALLSSTIGRVMLATATDPVSSLAAFASSYAVNLRPGSAEVVRHGANWAIVALRDVHYLLDSNHIGTWEGVLKLVGMRGEVLYRSLGPAAADFLITW